MVWFGEAAIFPYSHVGIPDTQGHNIVAYTKTEISHDYQS